MVERNIWSQPASEVWCLHPYIFIARNVARVLSPHVPCFCREFLGLPFNLEFLSICQWNVTHMLSVSRCKRNSVYPNTKNFNDQLLSHLVKTCQAQFISVAKKKIILNKNIYMIKIPNIQFSSTLYGNISDVMCSLGQIRLIVFELLKKNGFRKTNSTESE